MADCGAAGTTIDRAARAVLGSSNQGQEAAKHVGALFGHVTMGHQAAMPMSAPGHLTMPGRLQTPTATTHYAAPPTSSALARPPGPMDTAWNNAPPMGLQHSVQQPPPQMMMMHPPQQMMHPAMHHHQQQQQQQQAMHAAMFHQQQQMMQHQMQVMAAQQHHQQQQQSLQTKPISKDTANQLNEHVHDDLEHWHDGLEDEAGEYDEMLGHEGVVDGASIEQLSAAWAQAEAEYDQLADQEEDYSNLWTGEMPQTEVRPYEFINTSSTESPSETVLNNNWMEEGMKQFHDGNLKEAIRSFEMELQQNNPDNATAWRMLGRCHAENDMDPEAIKCLEAAVDRDPYSPDSLLALGVSYVNELNHERALENMKAWFTHNPKYAGMEMPTDIYGTASSASGKQSAFDEVKQLLLSALEFDATDAEDVHEALGVIFNVIKDYDAAAESFRKALEARPDDYQLWNKLGATLANGSQSDQALPAYHRALQRKPKYARAWLNMAISHSNLQDHDEAARCYLQTLSLNPSATHCWTYLRMALSCSERWDLLPLVFSQDLSAFKEHFDFVLY
jgi:peroxin-5